MPFATLATDHGGNLLLEFVSRRVAGLTPPVSWVADSEDIVSANQPVSFGNTCSPMRPTPEGSVQHEGLRPGLTTVFQLFGGRKATPYIHVLGFSDQLLMGYPLLPLALDAQGAPGCTLYTDLVFALPTLVLTSGLGQLSLPVPADPTLLGSHLFAQFLNTNDDRVNAALRLATFEALDVTLGTSLGNPVPQMSVVYGQNALANGRAGSVYAGEGAVVQLVYN